MPATELSLVLLPGMDGTGQMFDRFVAALPQTIGPVVVTYPVDRRVGYAVLEALADQALPSDGPFIVVGESFSGPPASRACPRAAIRSASGRRSGRQFCARSAAGPGPDPAAVCRLVVLPV